jgi:hypothetical protein
MNETVFTHNPFPRVGIRPIIDGRRRGVRESLEDQTMEMARAAAYGHIGADLITLASMLRIPVAMHNVPEEEVFRHGGHRLEPRTQVNRFVLLAEIQHEGACRVHPVDESCERLYDYALRRARQASRTRDSNSSVQARRQNLSPCACSEIRF